MKKTLVMILIFGLILCGRSMNFETNAEAREPGINIMSVRVPDDAIEFAIQVFPDEIMTNLMINNCNSKGNTYFLGAPYVIYNDAVDCDVYNFIIYENDIPYGVLTIFNDEKGGMSYHKQLTFDPIICNLNVIKNMGCVMLISDNGSYYAVNQDDSIEVTYSNSKSNSYKLCDVYTNVARMRNGSFVSTDINNKITSFVPNSFETRASTKIILPLDPVPQTEDGT